MKNIFKTMSMIAISTAMFALSACGGDEPTPDNNETYNESGSYAILYNGSAVAAGETLTFHPSASEIDFDWATIHLLPENKTGNALSTVMKVELAEGPDAMKDLSICYGETCKTGVAPWTSDPFTLEPGVNQNMEILFDYTPSKVTAKTTFKLTMGKGTAMEDPQVIFINVNAQ